MTFGFAPCSGLPIGIAGYERLYKDQGVIRCTLPSAIQLTILHNLLLLKHSPS